MRRSVILESRADPAYQNSRLDGSANPHLRFGHHTRSRVRQAHVAEVQRQLMPMQTRYRSARVCPFVSSGVQPPVVHETPLRVVVIGKALCADLDERGRNGIIVAQAGLGRSGQSGSLPCGRRAGRSCGMQRVPARRHTIRERTGRQWPASVTRSGSRSAGLGVRQFCVAQHVRTLRTYGVCLPGHGGWANIVPPSNLLALWLTAGACASRPQVFLPPPPPGLGPNTVFSSAMGHECRKCHLPGSGICPETVAEAVGPAHESVQPVADVVAGAASQPAEHAAEASETVKKNASWVTEKVEGQWCAGAPRRAAKCAWRRN